MVFRIRIDKTGRAFARLAVALGKYWLGKRVANVEAHAWQLDRSKPVAAAQMNVLLRRG